MNGLEVVAAAGGGIAVLVIAALTAAVWRGWVEGSASLRVVPLRKRKQQQEAP